jgi:Holliday junction resolvase RusA-like endonuclease
MTDIDIVVIEVVGNPAPQGSKRHVGDGVMIESSKHVRPWRADIAAAAAQVMAGRPVLTGPLVVDMVFAFARPKGHYGTGRNAGVLRPSAPGRPAVYPDLSKLARAAEDALTRIVWRDDALVVEYARLCKVYAGEYPDGPRTPGVRILVRPFIKGYDDVAGHPW